MALEIVYDYDLGKDFLGDKGAWLFSGATIKRCVKRFEAVVTFQVADSTIKTRKEAPP
jgi:hypothetical protein